MEQLTLLCPAGMQASWRGRATRLRVAKRIADEALQGDVAWLKAQMGRVIEENQAGRALA